MNKELFDTVVKALKADIVSKTNIPCDFTIDEKAKGDRPAYYLSYFGMDEVDLTPGGTYMNAEFNFKIQLYGRINNPLQLAALMEAELHTGKVLVNAPFDSATSDVIVNQITGISGYNVSYWLRWTPQVNSMDYTEFNRTWDLTLKITKE